MGYYESIQLSERIQTGLFLLWISMGDSSKRDDLKTTNLPSSLFYFILWGTFWHWFIPRGLLWLGRNWTFADGIAMGNYSFMQISMRLFYMSPWDGELINILCFVRAHSGVLSPPFVPGFFIADNLFIWNIWIALSIITFHIVLKLHQYWWLQGDEIHYNKDP